MIVSERKVEFGKKGHRKVILDESEPKEVPKVGRYQQINRLMKLALKCEKLLHEGYVKDYAELAKLGQVSRARMTHIMSFLNLATDIQEEIIFLPRIFNGRDPINVRSVLPIASEMDWASQRRMWKKLKRNITGMESSKQRSTKKVRRELCISV